MFIGLIKLGNKYVTIIYCMLRVFNEKESCIIILLCYQSNLNFHVCKKEISKTYSIFVVLLITKIEICIKISFLSICLYLRKYPLLK